MYSYQCQFLSIPTLILVTLLGTWFFRAVSDPPVHILHSTLCSPSASGSSSQHLPGKFWLSCFWVLCSLPWLTGTRVSCPIRGTVNHSSLRTRLIPYGSVIQRNSVFSLSSSCLYLKTYKPYGEKSYDSKYTYAGFRISWIYVWHLHSLPSLHELRNMLTTSTVENHSLPEIKLLLLIYLLVGGYSLQRQGKVLVKPPPVILATVSNFMMQFLTDPFRHSGIFLGFAL